MNDDDPVMIAWRERQQVLHERWKEIQKELVAVKGDQHAEALLAMELRDIQKERYGRPPNADWLRPESCVIGHLYQLRSRNLAYGVFRGSNVDNGFVGIRTKFDSRYLFTEFHADTAQSLGTAYPYLDCGACPISDLREYVRSSCKLHDRDTVYDRTKPRTTYALDTKPHQLPGTWIHVDDGSPLNLETDYSQAHMNQPLFDWLEMKEAELGPVLEN